MEVCLETHKEQTRGFGFGGCLLGNFFVFLQAFAGLWKFELVTVDELLLRCQSRFAGQGRAHFMD